MMVIPAMRSLHDVVRAMAVDLVPACTLEDRLRMAFLRETDGHVTVELWPDGDGLTFAHFTPGDYDDTRVETQGMAFPFDEGTLVDMLNYLHWGYA